MVQERSTVLSSLGRQGCVPRSLHPLKLTTAVLSVQLNKMVQDELRLSVTDVVFWTDSTSVLQYIRNENRRIRTYVANLVAKIQDATEEWRCVDSEFHPADEGSRGCGVDRMITEGRWPKAKGQKTSFFIFISEA